MFKRKSADKQFHFPDHEYDRTPFGDTIDKASMKLLKEAYDEADDKNVITSPLGIFTLLSVYSAGAPGKICEEIVQYLGAANCSELIKGYSDLNDKFSKIDPKSLTIASRIVVSNSYKLQSGNEFLRAASGMRTKVESANFKDNKAVVKSINDWVTAKTKGRIKNPLPDDAINSSVVLALFNVIFMQGHWNVPFKVKNTKEEDFYLMDNTTVKKPMMHLNKAFFYHENHANGFRMLELPYKEKGFRMVIVLPTKVNGLTDVIKEAQQGILEDVFNLAPSQVDIILHMPKFEIRSELNLNSLLPKVGVSAIFTNEASGIVKKASVKVNKAFQQAFVKIDEEGATAGAFTGVVYVNVSTLSKPPTPIEFKVDHPFLFLILYKDKILFTGTYTH